MTYTVEGDCCSSSYFFDMHGVEHLLNNGPVTAFEAVSLSPGDVGYQDPDATRREYDEEVKVYGYRLTTEHPKFGPVSSVFSFRNSSNGYYGGWMYLAEGRIDMAQQVRVTADVLDVEKLTQNVAATDATIEVIRARADRIEAGGPVA